MFRKNIRIGLNNSVYNMLCKDNSKFYCHIRLLLNHRILPDLMLKYRTDNLYYMYNNMYIRIHLFRLFRNLKNLWKCRPDIRMVYNMFRKSCHKDNDRNFSLTFDPTGKNLCIRVRDMRARYRFYNFCKRVVRSDIVH